MAVLIHTANRSLARLPTPGLSFFLPRKPLGLSTAGKIKPTNPFALAHAEAAEHAGRTYKYWKFCALTVCLPIIGYFTYQQAVEIMNEEHILHQFIPYKHMRIRNKPFPWGNKSLFHNVNTNPGPEGEVETEKEYWLAPLIYLKEMIQQHIYERIEREREMAERAMEDVLTQAMIDKQKYKKNLKSRENPFYHVPRPFNPKEYAFDHANTFPPREDMTPDGY